MSLTLPAKLTDAARDSLTRDTEAAVRFYKQCGPHLVPSAELKALSKRFANAAGVALNLAGLLRHDVDVQARAADVLQRAAMAAGEKDAQRARRRFLVLISELEEVATTLGKAARQVAPKRGVRPDVGVHDLVGRLAFAWEEHGLRVSHGPTSQFVRFCESVGAAIERPITHKVVRGGLQGPMRRGRRGPISWGK